MKAKGGKLQKITRTKGIIVIAFIAKSEIDRIIL